MIPPFRKIQTGIEPLDRVQDGLVTTLRAVSQEPLLNGLLISVDPVVGNATQPLILTTSFRNIPHSLGRAPQGWLVVSPNASATVWEDAPANNPDPTRFLRLRSSATVTLKILVF